MKIIFAMLILAVSASAQSTTDRVIMPARPETREERITALERRIAELERRLEPTTLVQMGSGTLTAPDLGVVSTVTFQEPTTTLKGKVIYGSGELLPLDACTQQNLVKALKLLGGKLTDPNAAFVLHGIQGINANYTYEAGRTPAERLRRQAERLERESREVQWVRKVLANCPE